MDSTNATNTPSTTTSSINPGNVGSNAQLKETVITVNGLPGNVNLSRATKMLGEFRNISNITFSRINYQKMGHSFMNAIVCINMKEGDKELSFQTESESGTGSELPLPEPREIKDRSVDKEEMKTLRRNVNPMNQQRQNQNIAQKQSEIDADALAKEIDELLADTDDEDESDDSD